MGTLLMRISYIQRLHNKSQNKKDKVDFICILRLREDTLVRPVVVSIAFGLLLLTRTCASTGTYHAMKQLIINTSISGITFYIITSQPIL